MELTSAMLQAAIDKAIEAGLLPKYVRKDQSAVDREVMKLVLQAALDAGIEEGHRQSADCDSGANTL